MHLLPPAFLAVAALASTAPTASATDLIWVQDADGYSKIPSTVSNVPPQDLEAVDDFDVVGSIERVIATGGPCFGCAAPDVQGVWVRFYDGTTGQVGPLQAEYFLGADDPGFSYSALQTSSLDVTLPTPFAATGLHFLSVQLVTDEQPTWSWWTSGGGQPLNATLKVKDDNGSGMFEPHSNGAGPVIERDLAFALWGVAEAVGPGPVELVWQQGGGFGNPKVPSSSYPNPPTSFEAADDFDFEGSLRRIFMGGKVCYQCPYPDVLGARVRFYEWTEAGPGTLLYDEYIPASQFEYAGFYELTLTTPFQATGKHFFSALLDTANQSGAELHAGSNPNLQTLWVREETQTSAWSKWDSGEGSDFNLSFSLYGIPDPVPPIVPTGDPCGVWQELFVPVVEDTTHSIIRDLDVIAADDVWAVASRSIETLPLQTTGGALAYHFDGAAWELVETPNPELYPGAGGPSLKAVAAVSSDEIWAAGHNKAQNGSGFVGGQVFVIRGDGESWEIMDTPITQVGSGANVRDIEVIAPDDIWFVGDWVQEGCDMALAMHWDGSNFTVVETPCSGLPGSNGGAGLEAVSAFASDDVWAVGGGGGGDSTLYSYIIHWDGSSWTYMPGPTPGINQRLFAVEAIAPDDVWAVGEFLNDITNYETLAIHWDGSSWTQFPTPGGSRGLVARASDEVYAAGAGIFRWDGSEWSLADDLGLLSGQALGISLAAIDVGDGCELYAAGRHLPQGLILPYAARASAPGLWTSTAKEGCAGDLLLGALELASGPLLGSTARVRLDDVEGAAGLTPGGALAMWLVASEAVASECGLQIPGWGPLGSPTGSLLVEPTAPLLLVLPSQSVWQGPGSPVEASVAVPADTALAGLPLTTQGVFLDQGPAGIVLTEALELTIGE